MFLSTLLIIPWIIYGFRNRDKRFLGLNQTKKSLLLLLVAEIVLFTTFYLMLEKPDPDIAGRGSFAWEYALAYEKGIFPLLLPLQVINYKWAIVIDAHYQFLYLLTALIMDYLLLKIISPQTIRFFK